MVSERISGTGIWSAGLRYGDRVAAAEAAAELEGLGYRALWVPDVGGDLFAAVEELLAATTTITVATGILNLWMHEASETAERYHAFTQTYGERFLVGIGVSHAPLVEGSGAGQYTKPLTRMREYLDALDAAPQPLPVSSRVLAALGPKMIELAGTRAAGTHPYLCTPELTARTRAALGDEPIVAPEQAVAFTTDATEARALARQHLSMYLALPNYAMSLLRLGFAEEDLADGGSDRLVDRVVAWGDEAAIAARVAEHRAAGADHVCIQVLSADPIGLPLDAWRALAPALV